MTEDLLSNESFCDVGGTWREMTLYRYIGFGYRNGLLLARTIIANSEGGCV